MEFVGSNIVIDGWLEKKGHFVKNWKLRYVIVSGSTLAYYTDKSMKTKKGEIVLDRYTRVLSRDGRSHNHKFGITNSSSFLELCAESDEQRTRWIKALRVHLGQEVDDESGEVHHERIPLTADQPPAPTQLNRLGGEGLRETIEAKSELRVSDYRPHVAATLDDSDNESSSSEGEGGDSETAPPAPPAGAAAVDLAAAEDISHLLPDLSDLL
jgi:hypothetical protein